MISTETFTNDQIPGFTGIMMDVFTVYANRESAEAFANDYATRYPEADVFGYARVITRADGKFLVAIIDDADETFFYAIKGN